MSAERLLDRFLRYVAIDTTASEGATTYPSSAGQLELGRMLADELRLLGVDDVEQDQHGIVTGTVPKNVPHSAPVVAWCAHLDTSPETSGAGVRPQVISKYAGGDIPLQRTGAVVRVAENPELKNLLGATLITTDGTTLLGADDKAGVAVIMEAVAQLMENPSLPRGPLRICFTCDEEIGRGVDHVDVNRLGAAACYTLDGQGADEIDVETFSADLAVVHLRGVNIHPSIAKGRMINAVRAAASFIDKLPRTGQAPEATADREGFLHPYAISGGVAEVELRILLRDFQSARLEEYAQQLAQIKEAIISEFPGLAIEVEMRRQYRNMDEGLKREPRAVALACEALKRLGRTARMTIVRGGTDGSRLTELGLPTPNLSTGQHNPHSPLEWACLDEMQAAVAMLVELAALWAQQRI